MTEAITVSGISKSYGDLSVLDNISLSVPQGALFGLLGPNGAGKTTLIGILGGLVRADSGEASILGHDALGDNMEFKRHVGIVPQELVYDPFFNVREALNFQSRYFGLGKNNEWIDYLLQKLQLVDKAKTNTRSLSGGMKRRLMIAQALVHRPPVIVLDEPTAGVDINLRLILWDFVRELNAEGRTIILTTHYLEEAEELCEEIALMNKGRIITQGKTADLIAACHNLIQVRLRLQGGDIAHLPSHKQQDDSFVFSVQNYSDIPQLLAAVVAAGCVLSDIEVSRADLEDVFVSMIKDS
ncbi:MAG: ABC transporter ATP-binding protein [Gammaproteobacteria bacterium WSBS_2016_MAG_OTU1]